MRVRLFYTPPMGSLSAFLSSKLLFWALSSFVMESAGTAILHLLRQAVCMHFYRSNCYFDPFKICFYKVRVRLFYTSSDKHFAGFFTI